MPFEVLVLSEIVFYSKLSYEASNIQIDRIRNQPSHGEITFWMQQILEAAALVLICSKMKLTVASIAFT